MSENSSPKGQTIAKKRPTMATGKETNIWRTYLELHRGNPRTYKIYELNLSHFLKFIRDCNPELNETDDKDERANSAFKLASDKLLDNYLLQMQKSGFQKNTIAIQIKVLKAFFNWVSTPDAANLSEHLKKYWNEWATPGAQLRKEFEPLPHGPVQLLLA